MNSWTRGQSRGVLQAMWGSLLALGLSAPAGQAQELFRDGDFPAASLEKRAFRAGTDAAKRYYTSADANYAARPSSDEGNPGEFLLLPMANGGSSAVLAVEAPSTTQKWQLSFDFVNPDNHDEARVRVFGIKAGQTVNVNYGATLAPEAGVELAGQALGANRGWTGKTLNFEVPAQTYQAVAVVWFANPKNIPAGIDNVRLALEGTPLPTVNTPTPAQPVAAPPVAPPPAVKRVPTKLGGTCYVAPAARGNGSGTNPVNAQELQAALEDLAAGGGQVVLTDGYYRGVYKLVAGEAPLTIRAQNTGKAIISGSDRLMNWTRDNATGVWSAPWTHDWGPLSYDVPTAGRLPYHLRREMVYVNGTRLLQRVGLFDANKPLSPSRLEAGQFTIDEANNRIFIKLPAGVSDPNRAVTEVTMRGANPTSPNNPFGESYTLFSVENRSNLTMSGLVFQHSAGGANWHPSLSIGGSRDKMNPATWPRNLTLSDCDFVDNNGVGFLLWQIRGASITRCRFDRNGEKGVGGGALRDVTFSDCSFSYNNWRFKGWLENWQAAGMKLFEEKSTYEWFSGRGANLKLERCRFLDNFAAGFWQDFAGQNTLVDRCLFDGNTQGISQEVTAGPLRVQNSVIRNGHNGVTVIQSPDITIENTAMYNLKGEVVMIIADDRTSDAGYDYRPVRMTLRDNVLLANLPGSSLFRLNWWGQRKNFSFTHRKVFTETLSSDFNHWYQHPATGQSTSDEVPAFLSNDAELKLDASDDLPSLSWRVWRQAEYRGQGMRQDQNSTYGAVPTKRLDAYDPTVKTKEVVRLRELVTTR
jgi:hypothetical protein